MSGFFHLSVAAPLHSNRPPRGPMVRPPYTFWANVIASFTNTGTPTQLQSIALSSGVPSTFGSNVTAGHLIIAFVQQASPGTPSSDPTVMDSQGNAYTAYGSYNTASSYTVGTWMFVATASATGAADGYDDQFERC